jgi:hypothetical protein
MLKKLSEAPDMEIEPDVFGKYKILDSPETYREPSMSEYFLLGETVLAEPSR